MRTLVLLNDIEGELKFAIVEEDLSEYQGEDVCENQLLNDILENVTFSEDKSLIENKEWDKCITITAYY